MARLVDERVGTRDGECVGGVRLAIALMANVWATLETPSSAGGPAYSPCTRNGEDRILARCGIQTSFYRRKAPNPQMARLHASYADSLQWRVTSH